MSVTISTKLYALILSVVCFSLLFGAYLNYQTSQLAEGYQDLISKDTASVESTRGIQIAFRQQVQEWKDILLRGKDPAMLDKYEKAFREQQKKVESSTHALLEHLRDPESKALLQSFLVSYQQLDPKYSASLAGFVTDKDIHRADMGVKGIDRAPSALLEKLKVRLSDLAQRKYESQTSKVASASRTAFAVAIGSYLLLAVAGILLVRRLIVNRLYRTRDVLEQVAKGDLTQLLPVKGHDELDQMAEAFNQTVVALRSNVGDIRKTVSELAGTSSVLASAAKNISNEADKQSTSVQEISAAIEQISGSITLTSQNTRRASELSSASTESAEHGTQAASQATQSMDEIKTCSKRLANSWDRWMKSPFELACSL